MSSVFDLTIAICTCNGENRVGKVLDKVKEQIIPQSINFEVLVIDNNSSDATARIIFDYQSTWNDVYPLRYLSEPEQGLAFARQCAIENSRSPLIGFLDDDNLPASNWIKEVISFAESHVQAGAFGSQIDGLFEQPPPEGFKSIACFLAIIDRGPNPFIYRSQDRILPPAAGLVIRRQVWLNHVPKRLFLIGRVDNFMLGSEDLEALTYIQKSGWEIWHNPKMLIQHRIPAKRLQKDYLLSLIRGTGLARHHIRMIRLESWQRPLMTPLFFVNDLQKIINFFLLHRLSFRSNTYLACEFQWLWSTLFSPYYLWKKHYIVKAREEGP